jgi:hypothetical protein
MIKCLMASQNAEAAGQRESTVMRLVTPGAHALRDMADGWQPAKSQAK